MKTSKDPALIEPTVHLSVWEYQKLLDDQQRLKKSEQRESQLLEIVSDLKLQVNLLKRRLWCSSSERCLPQDPAQLSICWNTPEDSPAEEVIEKQVDQAVEEEKKNYNRFRKNFKGKKIEGHTRRPLPGDLPRRVVATIDPEGDLTGADCIGQEVTEKLEIQPMEVYVAQTVRNKYKLPSGEIVIGKLPLEALWRSNAGASTLAHIAVGKYADHLPLHRQIGIFSRQGVRLAPSTVSNWCMAAAQELEPIYNEVRELLRQSRYVMADETTHKVLESDRPGSLHQGYMWNFYLPAHKTPYIEYHRGRGGEAVGVLLGCQVRVVQSDGYVGYDLFDRMKGYLHLACWAHARRKFREAEDSDPVRAKAMLEMIGSLYANESHIREKGLEGEEKVLFRRQKSYPVLRDIELWLEQNSPRVREGSLMAGAINYTYERMEQLSLYVTQADFQIDNNAVERSIRPLTLNRKNVLFSGSHDAAHAAAIYFTLFGCCRENGVNPKEWMQDALIRVKDCTPTDYSSLLPFNWKKS